MNHAKAPPLAVGLFYFQFFAPGGWTDALLDPREINRLFVCVAIWLIVGPLLYERWQPTTTSGARLERSNYLFQQGMFLAGPVSAIMLGFALLGGLALTLSGYSSRPLWLILMQIQCGLIAVRMGLDLVRDDKLLFYRLLYLIGTFDFLNQNSTMKWLNANMPDPVQQQALQTALNKKYPRSRARSVIGFIVLSVGGFIIMSAVGGVIEMYAQDWWNRLMCNLFKIGCG